MNNKFYIILAITVLSGCRYYGYIYPTRDVNSVIVEKQLKEKQKLLIHQVRERNEAETVKRVEEQKMEEESNNRIREDLDYYFR